MTTIVGIRKDNLVVIAGDGQASFGNTVMKPNVKKIRRLGQDDSVISGFAGSTADAFALFERLESKLDQYKNQLNTYADAFLEMEYAVTHKIIVYINDNVDIEFIP